MVIYYITAIFLWLCTVWLFTISFIPQITVIASPCHFTEMRYISCYCSELHFILCFVNSEIHVCFVIIMFLTLLCNSHLSSDEFVVSHKSKNSKLVWFFYLFSSLCYVIYLFIYFCLCCHFVWMFCSSSNPIPFIFCIVLFQISLLFNLSSNCDLLHCRKRENLQLLNKK